MCYVHDIYQSKGHVNIKTLFDPYEDEMIQTDLEKVMEFINLEMDEENQLLESYKS